MSTTSPRASANPMPHRVALSPPRLLEQAQRPLRVVGDDLTDHLLRVVGRVALHEEELASGGQLRQPRDQLPDVAALVAAGDDDADRGRRHRAPPPAGAGRATIPYISERFSQPGQVAHVAVHEIGDERDVRGQDDCLSVRTVSKSARESMFWISSGAARPPAAAGT